MEFETSLGTKVELRDFLPQKYALKQQLILTKGKTLEQLNAGEIDAASAIEAMAVVVEGMVTKLNGTSASIPERLENMNSKEYAEISEKCNEVLNTDKKKSTTV